MRRVRLKHPLPKVIAVDVDGTLIINGVVNRLLIQWCEKKRAEQFTLILWSSRGKDYALGIAEKLGVTDLFDNIIGKPGYIVDDVGWSWTKYTAWIPMQRIT